MKYGTWNMGQAESLLNILGGQEIAEAILQGRLTVEVSISPTHDRFDSSGRRISLPIFKQPVGDLRKHNDFYSGTLKVSWPRYLKILRDLPGKISLSDEEILQRADTLRDDIKNDKLIANILKSCGLPIVLPQLPLGDFNYRRTLIEEYIPVLETAYLAAGFTNWEDNKKQVPRKFINELGKLDEIEVVPGSRHDRLIAQMKEGSVVGIFFPDALHGFSVGACLEQMESLPERLLLSGGLDTIVATILHPESMAYNWLNPKHMAAAIYVPSSGRVPTVGTDEENHLKVFSLNKRVKESERITAGLLYV